MTGLLADRDHLHGALERLLSDPALRRRLGAAAREKALHLWTPEQTASALVAVYEDAARAS